MLEVKNAGLVSKPDWLDGELDGLSAQTPTRSWVEPHMSTES